MSLLMNIDAAATFLGLPRNTLYELTRNRSQQRQKHPIPFAKVGKKIYFQRESLERWVAILEHKNGKGGK